MAAAFTHFDSRAGDPQLHAHVVVLNRAQSLSDGRWRTLDSRGLFRAVVELSEMHEGIISDLLTVRLGWGWDGRSRRHSPRLRWEVTGVPEALVAEFSQRSAAIEDRKNVLVAEFAGARGRQPTSTEVIRIRQRATLGTRPDKTPRCLAEMTAKWQELSVPLIGPQPESWVASLADRNDLPLLHSGDLADEMLSDVARVALDKVGEATRGPPSRAPTSPPRFTASFAGSGSPTPTSGFLRPDGTSRFRSKGHERYCTGAVLDAESRLLDAGQRRDGPTVGAGTVASALAGPLPGRTDRLSVDQAVAVEHIAASGSCLDVLVGPAGTGKSMTMAGLRAVWEAEHGPGSVIGLAPSAAAAEVLADELGIDTENTAKWLTEHRRGPDRRAIVNRVQEQLTAANLARGHRSNVSDPFLTVTPSPQPKPDTGIEL